MPSEECLRLARFKSTGDGVELIPDSGAWDGECADTAYITHLGACVRQPCTLRNGGPCFLEGIQSCCGGVRCAGECVNGIDCACGTQMGGCGAETYNEFCKVTADGLSRVCAPKRNGG
jgi:hypothetical protein